MKLEQMYQEWAKSQKDNSDLLNVFGEFQMYIYSHFSEEEREKLQDLFFTIVRLAEQQAYIAGFCDSHKMISEVVEVLYKYG